MAASPRFKVYNTNGQYVAACKCIEDAACLVANYGDGASIRDGHRRVARLWNEGSEDQAASESFDHVAEVVSSRIASRAITTA